MHSGMALYMHYQPIHRMQVFLLVPYIGNNIIERPGQLSIPWMGDAGSRLRVNEILPRTRESRM